MEQLTIPDLEAILRGERFVEVEDKKALGIGLSSLFLFRDGHTHEKRLAVCECVDEFVFLAKAELRWQTIEGETVDLRKGEPTALEETAQNRTAAQSWFATYSSGADLFDAAAFEARFLCLPSWQSVGISSLRIQLPLSYLNGDFIGRFHRFASILRVTHAYAGVAVLQRQSLESAVPHESLVYRLAHRNPGLDVFSPTDAWESLSLQKSMRSINWLTAVGEEFISRLGKLEDIYRDMSRQILVYSYEGGAIFQAGPKPELGDSEKGITPEYYREVARALKPVRLQQIKYRFQQGTCGRPNFDLEETLRWLGRFD